ncbi:2-keto-4-pentenoate hydratase [Azospirillum fermentarium]|uniref:2-keto-4-pentenoate hydratase n=1 Tax=Azospirillum fermentarium TaxID=1233114 RepID=UPI0022276185|nr:fumarylacetoacetate hydrolase family protein [Azospirillum fermentarium]MCW2248496.1 2-keto-4-pentenoate hydratase [Azospirillum fermentarium]
MTATLETTALETAAVQDAADRLWAAHGSGTPCGPLAGLLAPGDVDAAYAVQEINTRRWLDQGRVPAGRKIGLTSLAVQTQLGVDQPDYGMLFTDMAVPDGEAIPRRRLIQPKAEAEVAFVLGRDLTSEHITLADVIRAVEFALPAIEVVDSRIRDWKITITDTVADNASSGLYVLGGPPRRLDGLDLYGCAMEMDSGGTVVSSGTGAACLGHPLNAVLWLARVMVRAGRPLKAGDTVLSGALGPMVPVTWGSVVEARIQGLGSVRAAFAKE